MSFSCALFLLLLRGDSAAAGPSAEAAMGADVEVDCRAGAYEHVVHLPGRPGSTLSLQAATSSPATHTSNTLQHTVFVDATTKKQVGEIGFASFF